MDASDKIGQFVPPKHEIGAFVVKLRIHKYVKV